MALGLNIAKIKRDGLAIDLDRLSKEGYTAVTPEDSYRLKMYGICVQRHDGFFMLRMRIPAGRMTPDQMVRVAELASGEASGYVHLTTRQNIELHSIRIEKGVEILRKLKEVGITTRSACGHTFRNVISNACAGTCPHELVDTRPWVDAVSQMVVEAADYYNHKLPKRLNVSFAGCTSCSSHALVNDIGLSAVKNAKGQVGFRVEVGGSMGVTPKLGYLLKEFVPLDEAMAAIKTVALLYIQHGDFESPAKGRLKFLIEEWGIERFRAAYDKSIRAVQNETPRKLPTSLIPEFHPANGVELPTLPPGVTAQRQKGFYRVAVFVPLGEIHHSYFTRYAQWARENNFGRVVITKEQNLEFQWVPGDKVQSLLTLAKSMGSMAGASTTILDVQACPGTSFCSLAVTSSQGAAQALSEYFDTAAVFANPFLRNLRVHVSGCPNSCAQHQGADLGFSGFTVKVGSDNRFAYQLYLGGAMEGIMRMGTLAKKGIADQMIVPVTDALFTVFLRDKEKGEVFHKFLERMTIPEVIKRVDELLVERGLSPTTYNPVATEAAFATSLADGG